MTLEILVSTLNIPSSIRNRPLPTQVAFSRPFNSDDPTSKVLAVAMCRLSTFQATLNGYLLEFPKAMVFG